MKGMCVMKFLVAQTGRTEPLDLTEMFLKPEPVSTGKTTSLHAYIDYLWNQVQSRNSKLNVYTLDNHVEIMEEKDVVKHG